MLNAAHGAPQSSWFLDEIGTTSLSYIVDDDLGSNDGKTNFTFSTGNGGGKICSALDLTLSSTKDYVTLGEGALDGATDLTVSFWNKTQSSAGRSFLSGSRTGQMNELIMWFTGSTRFNAYIGGPQGPSIYFPSIADNKWHHLVWRRSGAEGCFFTDSVERGCVKVSNKTLDIESLILGQEQDSLGGRFDIRQDWEGIVDELLIFRSALTNVEIESVYKNQSLGNTWDGKPRVCANMPDMSIKKVSQVTSDPVNGTVNPKRIPGATVRYTVTAENANANIAEGVDLKDSLNNEISNGRVQWLGNIVATSPNINGGAATPLTDAAGDDEGQFDSNNLITVNCGDISNVAPCVFSYDVIVKSQ